MEIINNSILNTHHRFQRSAVNATGVDRKNDIYCLTLCNKLIYTGNYVFSQLSHVWVFQSIQKGLHCTLQDL